MSGRGSDVADVDVDLDLDLDVVLDGDDDVDVDAAGVDARSLALTCYRVPRARR